MHIGRRPILAFGNSDGDLAMMRYALSGAGARLALLLHHDDAEREFAYDREFRLSPLAEALDHADDRWLHCCEHEAGLEDCVRSRINHLVSGDDDQSRQGAKHVLSAAEGALSLEKFERGRVMSNSVTMTSAKQAQLEAPGKPPFENMVWIPGGTFLMGSDKHYPEEAPAHQSNRRWLLDGSIHGHQ